MSFRRVTVSQPQLIVTTTQYRHQLWPQVISSPTVRSLLTQQYFEPLPEDMKSKDPTEVIQNLDPDTAKKLKIIQMEYEVLLQMGNTNLPEEMTDARWLEMLQFNTSNARRRQYRYLKKIEVNKLAKKQKREQRLQEGNYRPNYNIENPKNSYLMFVRQKTMNQFYYSRLANSILFGQPIIFDMDFEHAMRQQDVIRLFEQFLMAHGSNKVHKDPFHFVLCNHKEGSHFQKIFENSCTNRSSEEYLFTLKSEHYLDLYPHKDLVYLTPDAPNELTTFDHSAVYIIGGLVDKVNARPLTLAKAKRERIKMAKFPLDRYLKWTLGNKSLTLNQAVDILLEMKLTNDWQKALVHVPRRKVTDPEQLKQMKMNQF